MGKLTWEQLGRICGSTFDLTPNDAAEILAASIFQQWHGSKNKVGRMWRDQENQIKFLILLSKIDDYQKQHKLKSTRAAIKRMWDFKEPELNQFISNAKVKIGTFKTFNNLFDIWIKLPFVKQPLKTEPSYKEKQLAHALEKQQKKAAKLGLLRKR